MSVKKGSGRDMAKDMTDLATVDFISPTMDVVCGQVLMDRQRHIAIVVRKGSKFVQLVRVQSGTLRLVRCSAKEIVSDWMDAQYPFNEAMAKLLDVGKRQGITDGARIALEELLQSGKEPTQTRLF